MNKRTEILQYQQTSIITDQNQENEYGLDVSCNLGSLDIHKAVMHKNFEQLVDTSIHLLTNVSTMTEIVNVHGHLVSQGLQYGSKKSIAFIDAFTEALNFYSIKASMNIAKKRGETFYRFEDSEYANGA